MLCLFYQTNVHTNMIYLTDAQNSPRENIPCEDKIKEKIERRKTEKRRYIRTTLLFILQFTDLSQQGLFLNDKPLLVQHDLSVMVLYSVRTFTTRVIIVLKLTLQQPFFNL